MEGETTFASAVKQSDELFTEACKHFIADVEGIKFAPTSGGVRPPQNLDVTPSPVALSRAARGSRGGMPGACGSRALSCVDQAIDPRPRTASASVAACAVAAP